MSKPIKSLQSLEFRSFVAGFRNESASFWLLCFYIFMEYIRPQDMYRSLDILPWGQLAILGCFASLFITNTRAIGFGAMDKLFIFISVLVILSGVFAFDPSMAQKKWAIYASWILMYFCVVSVLTTSNRILLFALFFILINFKLSQFGARAFATRGFSFADFGLSGSPGWFANSGELALEMVVVFSMSLSLLLALRENVSGSKRWWILLLLFPGTTAITVIGSSSRGGQLALVAVLLVFILKGKQVFKRAIIFTILAYVGMYFLPAEQLARFNTMGDDKTSQLRLEHWEDAMETIENNPLGIGYYNWIPYYDAIYHPEALEQIHNTFLQAIVELGYPGGILFHLMLIVAFVMNIKTNNEMKYFDGIEEKSIAAIARGINLGLLGTIIAAFFMSVLWYPMFWLAFALTSALRHISQSKVKASNKLPVPFEKKQIEIT